MSTSKSSSQQDLQPQKEKELPEEEVLFPSLRKMPDRDLTHQGSTVARLRLILCFASSHKRVNVCVTGPLMLFPDCKFMFANWCGQVKKTVVVDRAWGEVITGKVSNRYMYLYKNGKSFKSFKMSTYFCLLASEFG